MGLVFIQREQHEQMQRSIMYFRSRECNWEIIGKEGAGRFVPDQWSTFKSRWNIWILACRQYNHFRNLIILTWSDLCFRKPIKWPYDEIGGRGCLILQETKIGAWMIAAIMGVKKRDHFHNFIISILQWA